MSNYEKSSRATFDAAIMEMLEPREHFSVAVLSENSFIHHAQKAAPAALLAAAKTAKPKVSAMISTAGTGLTGKYFSDAEFETAFLLRNDPTIKIAPKRTDSATIQANTVRWTGEISPSYIEAWGKWICR